MRTPFFLLFILFLILLQLVILPFFSITNFIISLPLIFTVFVAIAMEDFKYLMMSALVCGLIIGIISGVPFGIILFSFIFAGVFAHILKYYFFVKSGLYSAFVIMAIVSCSYLISAFLLLKGYEAINILPTKPGEIEFALSLKTIIFFAVFNSIAIIICYFPFSRFIKIINGFSK